MKLGIVGSGMIAETVLGFIDEVGFEEIYLCGRKSSEQKVLDLAEDFEVSKVFFDYDELLSSDVDLVYIALLNDMHYEYSRRALEACKHVAVEKPATITKEELVELNQIAKKNNVYLFEAMSIYHMPAFKELQKDLSLVGNLKMVCFNYSQVSSRYRRFVEGETLPVFDPKHNGGALRDLNVYNLAAMVGLFGMPQSVEYASNIEKGVDTSGVLLADFDSFKVCCIAAKDSSAPGPSTIQGDAATICIYPNVNGMTEYDVIFNDSDSETKEVDLSDGSHRLFFEFAEFLRIIEENDRGYADKLMEYSLMSAEIIDNCVKN